MNEDWGGGGGEERRREKREKTRGWTGGRK